jgi:hypothetical protein
MFFKKKESNWSKIRDFQTDLKDFVLFQLGVLI